MPLKTHLSCEELIKVPLKIGKRITGNRFVGGGMGAGISARPLSGKVAGMGGIGTLSSAGLYKLPQYKYLLDAALAQAKTIYNPIPDNIKSQIYHQVQLECIRLEIINAKKLADGNGLVFMNFLFALESFDEQVIAACKAGVDGVVSGAGIAWNLPAITKDYPDVAIGIMLSDPKGVRIVTNKWKNEYGRTPDFFVFEDPGLAAGHLGIKSLDKIYDPNLSLSNSIPIAKKWLIDNGYNIPIIGAGGIADHDAAMKVLSYGADAVQIGTRLAASIESGAHDNFKQAIVNSTSDDIVTWMSSVGLPARGLRQSPILEKMKTLIAKERKCIEDCLLLCGLRDGDQTKAQMCILKQLISSTQGSKGNGLMFAGTIAADIHDILSVKQIMEKIIK